MVWHSRFLSVHSRLPFYRLYFDEKLFKIKERCKKLCFGPSTSCGLAVYGALCMLHCMLHKVNCITQRTVCMVSCSGGWSGSSLPVYIVDILRCQISDLRGVSSLVTFVHGIWSKWCFVWVWFVMRIQGGCQPLVVFLSWFSLFSLVCACACGDDLVIC